MAEELLMLFITCPRGVEDLLHAECEEQGITGISSVTAGVHVEATLQQAYRLCLWSRVASRVLLRLDQFPVTAEQDLYNSIGGTDWSRHIDVTGSLAVDVKSSHATLDNTHFAALRVKDAVVDQFRERCGERPQVDRDSPDIRIHVYIGSDEATVYIDLSGKALHQRGYRQSAGIAPLKENLAAAILLRSRWPQAAGAGRPLLDPMCGAATLLIEAAMIATRTAPGLLRRYYGFLGWKLHDDALWQSVRQEAENGRRSSTCRIVGIEKSFRVAAIARENVRAAGFEERIDIVQADSLSAYRPGEEKGLVVTNPPYGKRLGVTAELKQVYLDLGQALKRHLPGWEVSLFTADHELARFFGLRAHRTNVLYNGRIKCTLYQYRLRESAPEDVTEGGDEERAMFANRLRKNVRHLSKWAKRGDIRCFRVYDADIPQFSAAVDVYDGWVRVQEYAAPRTVNPVRAFVRLNEIVRTVADILEVNPERVIVKQRKKQSGSSQYERERSTGATQVVTENGLKFLINLHDYLDTGLFTDHRITRGMIRELAEGRTFLNLFAYTGTATVYAAAGGARSTLSVDMSNTYLEWAKQNMSLNGFKAANHRYVRQDCLQWLEEQANKGRASYELIFLDPPTFSNSSSMEQTLDIQRDHVGLIRKTLQLLDRRGLLIFSCNARGFRLDEAELAEVHFMEITRRTTPEDYRKKPLHRCWAIGHDVSVLRRLDSV